MNMSLSDSLSAKLQTALTTWRNPLGKEKNWITKKDQYKRFPQVWTIVKCEGAYGFLACVAAIEWAASFSLYSLSYPLICCNSRPYKTFKHWNNCSKISIEWAISNMGKNVTEPNMITTPENYQIEQNRQNLLIDPFKLHSEAPLDD